MSACGDSLDRAWQGHTSELASRQEDVHLFFALRSISFIRQAFLVARHLLIGALGSMLLLVLAVAAFDFQPKAEVLTILGTILLVMAGWVCTAPDCLDQRLASGSLAGDPSLAGLVGRVPA